MSETRDSNGNLLADGVTVTLKRGMLVRNIRITDDPAHIVCNAETVKGLVLRTEFLKKA